MNNNHPACWSSMGHREGSSLISHSSSRSSFSKSENISGPVENALEGDSTYGGALAVGIANACSLAGTSVSSSCISLAAFLFSCISLAAFPAPLASNSSSILLSHLLSNCLTRFVPGSMSLAEVVLDSSFLPRFLRGLNSFRADFVSWASAGADEVLRLLPRVGSFPRGCSYDLLSASASSVVEFRPFLRC